MPRVRRTTNRSTALKIAEGHAAVSGRKHSPIEGKQHVDVLFPKEEVNELDRDLIILGVPTRADAVRKAVIKQRWFIRHCAPDDTIEIKDAEGRLRFRMVAMMIL